jgi:hypothetical protein
MAMLYEVQGVISPFAAMQLVWIEHNLRHSQARNILDMKFSESKIEESFPDASQVTLESRFHPFNPGEGRMDITKTSLLGKQHHGKARVHLRSHSV